LRKQRRLLFKKIKDLGDRETQNIFKLKIDKMLLKIPVKFAKILKFFLASIFLYF
jgi:hypothetical protein